MECRNRSTVGKNTFDGKPVARLNRDVHRASVSASGRRVGLHDEERAKVLDTAGVSEGWSIIAP